MKYTSLTRYQRTPNIGYNVQSDFQTIELWRENIQRSLDNIKWSLLIDEATGKIVEKFSGKEKT